MTIVINGTTGISGVDGSAGTPAVQGTDTNTGVFFPAADTIAFTTGGTEDMRIDSSGNVGIGVAPQTSTTSALTIQAKSITLSAADYPTYLVNSYYDGAWKYTANGMAWGIGNNFGGPTNGMCIALAPVNSSGAGAALTWTPRLSIDSSGNVGIGTSSPGYKFEVTGGDVRTNTAAFLYANTLRLRGSDTYQIYESAATTNLQIGTNGAAAFIFSCVGVGERMRIDSSGNLQFNSGYGSVATAYGCRAWVNFNGTGTVAIRASGNVSSITDNGVGSYTVNFTNAMPDANYGIAITAGGANSGAGTKFWGNVSNLTDSTPPTTTTMRFLVGYSDTTTADCSRIQVAIFR